MYSGGDVSVDRAGSDGELAVLSISHAGRKNAFTGIQLTLSAVITASYELST